MVSDPELQSIVSWIDVTTIAIKDEVEFIRVALPKYFQRSNVHRYISENWVFVSHR